jgi:hypothetical protein
MMDYVVRHGYLPAVFTKLDGSQHLRMISDAHDGNPEKLCELVLVTQIEMMARVSSVSA